MSLLNGIRRIYASIGYVKIKGGENESFRIGSGVMQGCVMTPLVVEYVQVKEVFMGKERMVCRIFTACKVSMVNLDKIMVTVLGRLEEGCLIYISRY